MFGVWELLIILVIVLVLFGAKRLKNVGGDLGEAIKNFRGAVKEGSEEAAEKEAKKLVDEGQKPSGQVIDVEPEKAESKTTK